MMKIGTSGRRSGPAWDRAPGRTSAMAVVLGACALMLGGCAVTTTTTVGKEPDPERLRLLERSAVKLGCQTAECAYAFNKQRGQLLSLHDKGFHAALAEQVMALGYDHDLAYYYLGYAAEGLGYGPAALTYYRMARVTQSKCAAEVHTCNGFRMETLLPQRIGALEARLGPAATLVYPMTRSVDARGLTKYAGPNIAEDGHTLVLRAWQSPDGQVLYQVYLGIRYQGPKRNYASATDRDGKAMRVALAGSDQSDCRGRNCMVVEYLSVTLPRPYLAANIVRGLQFTVIAPNSRHPVFLPGSHLKEYLRQVP
jgi:hypothetical protein